MTIQALLYYFLYLAAVFITTSAGTQILKKYFNLITSKKISFKGFTQDGGFPSSHTAFSVSWTVIAIFTVIKLYMMQVEGTIMLLACVVGTIALGNTCVVIRDALGVRRTVQILCDTVKKAAICNGEVFQNVKFKDPENASTKKIQQTFEDIAKAMNIKSGHLPHEVIGGACWGILISGAISSFYFDFKNILIYFIIGILVYVLCISIFIMFTERFLKILEKIKEIFK